MLFCCHSYLTGHFKISFPHENEAIKHDLVEFMVQCLKTFRYQGTKSTILLFNSIFRTTYEVSSKRYYIKISQVPEKGMAFKSQNS